MQIHTMFTSQLLTYLLDKPESYYHVHKSPQLDPQLSKLNPIHTLTPYVFMIHFNITPTSTFFLSFCCFIMLKNLSKSKALCDIS